MQKFITFLAIFHDFLHLSFYARIFLAMPKKKRNAICEKCEMWNMIEIMWYEKSYFSWLIACEKCKKIEKFEKCDKYCTCFLENRHVMQWYPDDRSRLWSKAKYPDVKNPDIECLVRIFDLAFVCSFLFVYLPNISTQIE